MAVTRIKNNQITDLTVNAAAKLQDYSITSGKIANNLTYGSDLTIAGNLTVSGNVTAIDTIDLIVEDPLILLAKEQTGTPTLDIGYIGERGDSDNIAFVWDESADQFVAVFTDSSVTNSTININSYASMQVLDITASNANITGNLTFNGTILGNVTVDGNVDAENFNANASVSAVTVSASGNITGGNLVSNADVTTVSVTASGNITGQNLTSNANIDGVTVTASGNVNANNAVITNDLSTATVSASGNVTAGNLVSNADVTTVTVSASGNVTAGNLVSNADVTTVTVSASGNITGQNLTSNANIDGVTVTASGNVNANNAVITNDLSTATVSASGNVTAGNLISNADVTTVTVSASGNVTGGNLVSNADVSTVTVSASGNITGQNITSNANVDGVTVTASGNVNANNAVITNDLSTATVSASGNITAGNLVSNADVTTVTVSASGNVTGGNLISNADVTTVSVSASGNITGQNITSNANVDGVTVTASGNVNANNAVITNDLSTATVSASGNITAGNLVSNADVTTVTVSASGNITGQNIASNANVDGVTITASGNVNANNAVITNDLSTSTVSASGNIIAANINANSTVTAVDIVASSNVDAGTVNTDNLNGNLTITTSGDLTLAMAGNLQMGGKNIKNLADPVAAQDAATKEYVDNAVSAGLTIHTPVQLESPDTAGSLNATYAQGGNVYTVTDIVGTDTVVFSTAANLQVNDQLWFTSSFDGVVANKAYFVVSTPNTSAAVLTETWNGQAINTLTANTGLSQSVRVNSGQGATLTNAGANAALVIDGVTVTAGDRVLIYNQTTAYENGVYEVTTVGDGSTAWVLTRASDMNTYKPDDINGLDAGDYFFVESGNTGAGESYVMTDPVGPLIIGYDALTFTQFSSSQVYSAGDGLALTGTVFSVNVDNDTTAIVSDTVVVKAGANLVTPNIGDATGNSLTLSGNGLLSATTVTASGNITGGNLISNAGITTVTVSASGNVTAGNLVSNADVTTVTVSASGNITGQNLTSNANVSGVTVTASGNVNANNAVITNDLSTTTVSASGNITGQNLTSNANIDGVTVTASGNVNANNAVITNDLSTTTVSASGNVTAGNLVSNADVTTVTVSASGNITGQNLTSNANIDGVTVTASGNVNANNAVITNDLSTATVSASGNITAGNLVSNADVTTVTVSASGNVTGGNLVSNADVTTVTVSASGNVTAGNLVSNADVTTVTVSASGNVTAGNLVSNADVTTVTVSASGNVTAGNLVSNADVSTVTVSASGNITGQNLTSNANIDGVTVTASGNVNANNAVITNDTSSNTFTATTSVTTPTVTSTGALTLSTASDGNITLDPNGNGVIILADETANRMLFTGTNKEIATDANATFDGANLVITGSATVDNVVVDGQNITSLGSELTINDAGGDVNFRVAGDNDANLLFVDAGTDTVIIGSSTTVSGAKFVVGTTDSMLVPVGSTAERPVTPTTGMVRFNTTLDALEFYDSTAWTIAGADFTVIQVDSFTGDGSNVAFTLSGNATTASTIVAINGVVQIPTTAYSVTGNVLTFTEAPETTDVIDVRILTTTTEISGLTNASGNASVFTPDGGDVEITGNLIPIANVTYNIGSSTARWNELYLAGNTITLGSIVIKDSGSNQIGFFQSDGVTPATIDSDNVDTTTISNGTSNLSVVASNGNITASVNGNAIVSVTADGIVNELANGVGNIGSATTYFNTVFAKATSAQYADLAEMYEADQPIEPGTVVHFGGAKEVSVCDIDSCSRIAGVVSTNPSYLMNSAIEGEHTVAVALTGRVPCRVVGPVRKGDMMVSAGDGRARAEANPKIGTVIGKALADFDGDEGVIEVVVGRL